MQTDNYTVYIKVDEQSHITAVNSSAFLLDTTDYIAIDEGQGDKYHHAQGHYFDLPLYDEQGCHNYIYDSNKPRLATAEEKAAEMAGWPKPEPVLSWDTLEVAIKEGVNEV